MRINREGYGVILTTAALCATAAAACWLWAGATTAWGVTVSVALLLIFVVVFFRDPLREAVQDDGAVISPCDGKVVIVERVRVDEYFGGRECVQVSIFMSLTNVHSNFYPVSGTVTYHKYHPGRFLVAWHPKSSTLNERTTTVVDTGRREVLFRQVAGIVARRIVSYPSVGDCVEQGTRCGFIKFGSRLDVFLPVDAEVTVRVDDRVTAAQTILARI
jgi:phosphatidylserine decarboxylase